MFISLPQTPTDEQLQTFVRLVFALQKRYGGLLDRIRFGDKGCHLLLFWGAPTSYENDLIRALNFILDLRAQAEIPLKAGLTYRVAHAGFVGSPLHEEYTCYGRGVNIAARFMTHVTSDAIWLDDAIAQHVQQHFDVQFAQEIMVKGVVEPQLVYELNGRRTSFTHVFYQSDMVGREQEIRQLQMFAAPLFSGQFAGVFTITGEAGMGKSRLAHEFVQSLSIGQSVFLCQTDEILRQPLNPFRYFLRQYFAYVPNQSEADKKGAFDTELNELINRTTDLQLQQELRRTRYFLAALIDLYWPDSLYARLEPELRQQNSFLALETLLKAESSRAPVILQIEDAQWLDADSRSFLRQLTTRASDYPILILITARESENLPQITADLPQKQLELQALSQANVAQLATSVLRQKAAPKLVQLLMERADGHPFYVEQMTLYLQEQDLLQESLEGIQPISNSSVLPIDVWAILIARLDRLTQSVKQVVQTAAVLGREFALPVLLQMLRDDVQVEDKVQTAVEARVWIALNEIKYLFKHALMREAAYEMQLQARRQELHSLAAEAIEQTYTADLAPYYGDLAYHFHQAQNLNKECHYSKLAGLQAAERFAMNEAINYLSRALQLTPRQDIAALYQILEAREAIYHVQGARKDQIEDLSLLIGLADRLEDMHLQAKAALRWAIYADVTSDFQLADEMADKAAQLAEAVGDIELQAAAHLRRGRALWRQGNYQASREQLTRSLQLQPDGALTSTQAESLQTLGALFAEQGSYIEAQDHYRHALAICQQLHDKKGESTSLNGLGVLSGRLGNYVAAKGYYQEALKIRQEMGYLRGQGQILNNLGVAVGYLGDYAEAKSYYEQSLRIRVQIGDRRGEGMALGNIGAIYAHLGRYAEARQYCQRSVDVSREIGDRWGEGWALSYLGLIAHYLGEEALALEICTASLEVVHTTGDRSTEAEALVGQAHAYTAIGQLDEAERLYTEALAVRRHIQEHNRAMEPLAGLAQVALLQGQVDGAQAYVAEIQAHLQDKSLIGALEMFWVRWICYGVLTAVHAPQAASFLQESYEMLQERAIKIGDAVMRHSYLQNVAAHCQIVEAWQHLVPMRP
jgi:predicted ATPase